MIGSMPGALGPPDTQGGQLSDPVSCPQPPRYLNQPGCQAAGDEHLEAPSPYDRWWPMFTGHSGVADVPTPCRTGTACRWRYGYVLSPARLTLVYTPQAAAANVSLYPAGCCG